MRPQRCQSNPDMRLSTTVPPAYLPDHEQQRVARLGLNQLDPAHWIDVDSDFKQFHSHKTEQFQLRPDSVYGELPGSGPAVTEFIDMLKAHLLTHYPRLYNADSDYLRQLQAELDLPLSARNLWQASLWVQEDICLLQEIDGEYRLTAASVCSPSNWHPADKLGRSMDVIHQPVPGYEALLSRRVNSLFKAMSPSKPLLRFNWSLQYGNELYWRDKLQPRDLTEPRYWRVERQTLRRLPRSGAIVFMIRIYLHKQSEIEQDPVVRENLRSLLARLPEEEKIYKGLDN